MKKMLFSLLAVTMISLSLTSCVVANNNLDTKDTSDKKQPQTEPLNPKDVETTSKTDIEKATEVYNQFLKGEISVGDIDIDYLTIPTGEPDKHYAASYAFFDSNGDGIPDLHVRSRYYYIFTLEKGELVIWNTLGSNPMLFALDNGTFISRKYGAAPMHDMYNYIIYDFSGKEIFSLGFSKYDLNENDSYDSDDEYLFGSVDVSKEQWEALTSKYLYIDQKGVEQVRNEIQWNILFEAIY